MIIKEYKSGKILPLYEVKELTLEEALLVLAAEKESLLQKAQNTGFGYVPRTTWMAAAHVHQFAAKTFAPEALRSDSRNLANTSN